MKTIFDQPTTSSPGRPPPVRYDAIRPVRPARREERIPIGPFIACRYVRSTMIVAAALLYAAIMISQDGHNAAVIASISLAAFLGSIAGFAFSAICGAVLFHLSDDPVKVVEIMIVCSIANQASMTWSLRHNIEWRSLISYLGGGAIGLVIGVWILLHADRRIYTQGIGVFLLAYGGFMLFRKSMVLRFNHPALDVVIGALGGITGGAAGLPSAALSIWIATKGWDRLRQRAVMQPFILIMQVAALLAISLTQAHATGLTGLPLSTLLFIPISLVGTSFGMALCRRMSDNQFARAINVMLIVSGTGFMV